MDNKKKIVLVPWDFSKVSHFALQHAINFARYSNCSIQVIHIIPGNADTDNIISKIEKETAPYQKDTLVKIETVVKRGKLYNTINTYSDEIKAELVVMGTHGILGRQKLFGSKALKVIAGSKIPFLTVQDEPEKEHENIVLPFDYTMEGREKMKWVVYFADHYNLHVKLFKKISAFSDLQQTINNNIAFAKRILDEYGISYDISVAPNMKEFPEEVIDFATQTRASLVMVMTTRDIGLADYMFGAGEQKIIANKAQIPVLCINPRDDIRKHTLFN